MLIINRFFIFIFCFFCVPVFAQLTTTSSHLIQAKTLQQVEVFAYIGDRFQPVAKVSADKIFSLANVERIDKKVTALYYPVQFGNAEGFIAKKQLHLLPQSAVKTTKVLSSSSLTGYVITHQLTPVFTKMDKNASPIGFIYGELRYPIIKKQFHTDKSSWYQVRFLGQDGFIPAHKVQNDNGIPILTYHHILKDEENTKFLNTSTTTSVDSFRFQLEVMQELGYQTAHLNSIEGYLKGTINLPARLLVMTFDDGLSSIYRYGYPLLKEFGFKATMFVITSRIKYLPQDWDPSSLQFLSIQQYHQMQDVFDLQSHTHFLHRYLNQVPIALQRNKHNLLVDFKRSIRELKRVSGTESKYLSYPFGAYNDLMIETAKEAGFKLGLSTKIGKVKFGADPFELKRVYLLKDASKARITSILEN